MRGAQRFLALEHAKQLVEFTTGDDVLAERRTVTQLKPVR